MGIELTKYDKLVIKSILETNQFNIQKVNGLESLAARCFIQDEYADIESLIKLNDIDAIRKLPDNQGAANEYLDIVLFSDERLNSYIATIYDSNELWQDPQVIEIYPL
jgi:hypothetical protein